MISVLGTSDLITLHRFLQLVFAYFCSPFCGVSPICGGKMKKKNVDQPYSDDLYDYMHDYILKEYALGAHSSAIMILH